jgi:TusA-related sulfurtransferase
MNSKTLELDMRGLICPFPLIKTMNKLKEIKSEIIAGKIKLKVITDHPAATRTISIGVKKEGLKAEVKELEKGVYEIYIHC